MTHKHTPAPWAIFTNGNGGIASLNPSTMSDICYFPSKEDITDRSDEEFEANAHLIAAAPELLEALKLAQGVIELGLAEAKLQNAYSSEKIDTHGIKRAVYLAIAKAEGK